MLKQQEITILLVEDNPGHARLIEKNLRRANISNQVIKLSNGQQAVDYLFGQGEYMGQERAAPLLVVLDLNMPILNGYQVLERMKADESSRRIPVAVLTTTEDPAEIARCYELGCNIYLTKPVEYEQFSEAIRKLGLFLTVARIPDSE